MFGLFEKKRDYNAKVNGSQTITVKAGDTLLKAALAARLAWPHKCQAGACSTCKCRLVEGKIKPLADFSITLLTKDLQNNYILACQTALKSDIELEVELLADGEQK